MCWWVLVDGSAWSGAHGGGPLLLCINCVGGQLFMVVAKINSYVAVGDMAPGVCVRDVSGGEVNLRASCLPLPIIAYVCS